jgi:hypothetical protein
MPPLHVTIYSVSSIVIYDPGSARERHFYEEYYLLEFIITCFHAGNLLGLFKTEDGGDMTLRNVC